MNSLNDVLSLKEISSFLTTRPSTSSSFQKTTNTVTTTQASSPQNTAVTSFNMHPPISMSAPHRYY